jgi:hypothetical protein
MEEGHFQEVKSQPPVALLGRVSQEYIRSAKTVCGKAEATKE